MHWFYLSAAIAFEVVGTTCMKLSDGFSKIVPVIIMFSCFGVAFFFNSLALRVLDLSITYAIWSGVGTAATAAIGVLFFKEPLTALKLLSLVLIVLGVIGLRFSVTDG